MMKSSDKTLGRPRDPATRQSIVNAAQQLFFELGYASVNISKIAEMAGVTRTTVYAYFDSKEEIFSTCLMDIADNKATGVGLEKLSIEKDIRSSLVSFGLQFSRFLKRDDILKAAHLLVSQSRNFPELSRTFFESAPDRTCKTLQKFLEDHKNFTSQDYKTAAEQLMSMWIGMYHMRMMHNVVDERTQSEWEDYIEQSVDVFLAGSKALE